jgi:hypothetical protein
MGATSVTGVSGSGSVAGRQKGSPHWSLGVEKLIGPRVVAAGQATLNASGLFTVDLDLSGAVTDYVGFANDTNATPAPVSVTGLTLTTMALKGTAAHVVNWQVVKVGRS